jgi:hypothetical protein
MRYMRAYVKSAAYPIKNYLNQHLLCSRMPLLSEGTKFEIELLFEQVNYMPSELLAEVLRREECHSTNRSVGKVAADAIPDIPLDEVRNCIAQSCPVLKTLLTRAKRGYGVYTHRLRARKMDPITFEQWLMSGNLRGIALEQMTVEVTQGWRRGSTIFGSKLGESSRNTSLFRSFCWMKGEYIHPKWRGVWFGRIYYFAKVCFSLPDGFHAGCQCGYQTTYDFAAVRAFERYQISPNDQFGYTANIRRGLNPKTHFLRLAGIGGRVVLADHPDEDAKKVILDIDRVLYPG